MNFSFQQGISLGTFLDRYQPTLTERLELFIDLVGQIRALQTQAIVHNDINPDMIQVDVETRSTVLIPSKASFKVSSDNPSTYTGAQNIDGIAGQIAYLSPEQTGRTAHPIDFRSDYYCLGAVLYYLLTGSPPFDFKNPLQMIHAHIAIPPTPVDDVSADIPAPLSMIASKLLAKNPSDRYQSSSGIIADLERCVQQLKNTAAIAPFTIGRHDVSVLFEIPQKIYGRYKEIKHLWDAYHQVNDSGVVVVLLNGPPGIGKSFLISEVQSQFVAAAGCFISGKFNQYETSIPCSAIIHAFAGLIRRMLTLSDSELAKRRSAILDAVGDNGQLIIKVIPELELIIGQQPQPEKLPAMETRNRFNYVFQRFIRAIADIGDPLIIFMDDLHWAENASLKLLETVLLDAQLRNVLFIGAYRDMEARENPYLSAFIERLRQEKPDFQSIALGAVGSEYVALLIEDMLRLEGAELDTLVERVVTKTSCNPLFIREFLIRLFEKGVLRHDSPANTQNRRSRWHIDNEKLLHVKLPDTVVELLTRRFQKLSGDVQESLKTAACIGTQFSLDQLSAVCPKSSREIDGHLKLACDQGFIVRVMDQFKFIHDRIRETAYQLIEPARKRTIHYAIGKTMLTDELNNASNDIFFAASQWNAARKQLRPDEKKELVRLNLNAGIKAKGLTAYPIALEYLNNGLTLLGENCWQAHYDMALRLHSEAAEVSYLNGQIDDAQRLARLVIQNSRTVRDQINAFETHLRCFVSQHKYSQATEDGVDFLRQFGLKLSKKPNISRTLVEFIIVGYLILGRKAYLDWDSLNEEQDEKSMLHNRVMGIIGLGIHSSQPRFFKVLMLKGLRNGLTLGPKSRTVALFAYASSFLCAAGKTETGDALGRKALSLANQPQMEPVLKASALLALYYGMSWRAHIRETLTPLLETYNFCMVSGNPEGAAYAMIFHCSNAVNAGVPLPDILSKIRYYSDILQHHSQKMVLAHFDILHQTILHLMGLAYYSMDRLDGLFDPNGNILSGDRNSVAGIYATKMMIKFFERDYLDALRASTQVLRYLKHDASISKPFLYCFDSLIRLALIRTALVESTQPKRGRFRAPSVLVFKAYHLRRVAGNQKKLKRSAQYSPVNFMHQRMLVEAERASICEKHSAAETCYQKAIELSKKHFFLHLEAIANECLARHYLARANDQRAQIFFKAAIARYKQWGAERKRVRLVEEYQSLFNTGREGAAESLTAVPSSSSGPSPGLHSAQIDAQLFSEAMDSISAETDLKAYLIRLSHIIMRYAGARRVLLLLNGDRLSVGVDNYIGETVQALAPLSKNGAYPDSMLQYVRRTRKPLLVDDATKAELFADDDYVSMHRIKSAVCIPVLHQGKLNAVLYLENNLNDRVFTLHHQKMLIALCGQIALLLENEALKKFYPTADQPPVTDDMLQTLLQDDFGLTAQEANISVLFKQGRTRNEICKVLNISVNTLRRHLQMIYDKTVNFETEDTGSGRVDKLSRLILFLFKLCETPPEQVNNMMRFNSKRRPNSDDG